MIDDKGVKRPQTVLNFEAKKKRKIKKIHHHAHVKTRQDLPKEVPTLPPRR